MCACILFLLSVSVALKSKAIFLGTLLCPFLSECFSVQMELTRYNPKDSLTGKLILCGQSFCKDVNRGSLPGCFGNGSCTYARHYGDGSYSTGFLVEDVVQYDLVSGDLQTEPANRSVIFG